MGKKRDRKGNVAPEPRRDQLDDQGRQRHIGHGDREEFGPRRPLDEGQDEDLGRPVRLEREGRPAREEAQTESDDKTEGTSRQLGPLK